jgi:hypothetical protein
MVAGVSRTYPQPPATVSLALTRLALKVIRKGAFIGLFLAGAIGANWTDECWHFARCHSQRLKVLSCYSTTYSHTRFRFLLVQFFSALLSHIVLLVKKLKLRAQSRDSGYRASKVYVSKSISKKQNQTRPFTTRATKPNDVRFRKMSVRYSPDRQQPSRLQDTEWVKTELSVSGRHLYADSRKPACLGFLLSVLPAFCDPAPSPNLSC